MNKTCFVISPIGRPGSDTRRRADDVFEGIIEPALAPLDYSPLRADQIHGPGKITDDVIEHITEVPMVIADLTDLNANVFYELSLRHVSEKPVVHIIHKDQVEQIPFDVQAIRTVPYSLMGAEMIRAQQSVQEHVKEAEIARATKNLLLDKVRAIGLMREPAGPDHLKQLQGTVLLGNWIRYHVIDSFLDNIPYATTRNIEELEFSICRIIAKAQEEGFTERARTLAAFPDGEIRSKVEKTFAAASGIIPPLMEALQKQDMDAIRSHLVRWRANNHEYLELAAGRILDLIRKDQPI